MQRKLITAGIVALLLVSAANAQDCSVPEVPRPSAFPDQPLNIIIPRSAAAGARSLSAEIVDAINNLKDDDGKDLNIEARLLFKFGGDISVAVEYYASLPPNGYNILQLADTYASLRAQGDIADDLLTPLAIAQVTFSQIYVRSDDTRFADLKSFADFVDANPADPPKIAKFRSPGEKFGLEDFLLQKFAEHLKTSAEGKDPPGSAENPPASQSVEPRALSFVEEGFESGSERYMSLFNKRSEPGKRPDALIDQPGDVAKLLENDLLKPIFTLLPEDKLPELPELLRAGKSFPRFEAEECELFYRFRGFFVHSAVPKKRREYLEWIFIKAISSSKFQEFNRKHYMHVFNHGDDILNSYCSSTDAKELVEDMVCRFEKCRPPKADEKKCK